MRYFFSRLFQSFRPSFSVIFSRPPSLTSTGFWDLGMERGKRRSRDCEYRKPLGLNSQRWTIVEEIAVWVTLGMEDDKASPPTTFSPPCETYCYSLRKRSMSAIASPMMAHIRYRANISGCMVLAHTGSEYWKGMFVCCWFRSVLINHRWPVIIQAKLPAILLQSKHKTTALFCDTKASALWRSAVKTPKTKSFPGKK